VGVSVFRHQHHEKFLSSFDKLGIKSMPDAVACAAYHCLSNSIGGVAVEFMRASDRKVWVNFVPALDLSGCQHLAMPSEVSRAILRGRHAHNGVSLGNARLGFICTALTPVLVERWGWRLMCGLEPLSPAVFQARNGVFEGALAVRPLPRAGGALPSRLGRRRLRLAHAPAQVPTSGGLLLVKCTGSMVGTGARMSR
jgi:hypothetical protein